jgi:hypothetical protein
MAMTPMGKGPGESEEEYLARLERLMAQNGYDGRGATATFILVVVALVVFLLLRLFL